MPKITRPVREIRAELTKYQASKENYQNALDAIALGGQSYELRDGDTIRMLTRANLPEIRNTISWLSKKISDLLAELAEAQGVPVRPRRIIFIRGVK